MTRRSERLIRPGEEETRRRPTRNGTAVDWLVAENPGPLTLDGTRCYVVGEERVVVVDPGPHTAGQLDALRRLVDGRTVEVICLTHAHLDHAGAASDAARAFGAPVAASPETLSRCSLHGIQLTDGERLPVAEGRDSLVALATPGHSADHTAYLLEGSRALFTGDLVLGTGSSAVLHPDGSVAACLASLSRLRSLRPGTLYPGHGPPVADGTERLALYREHRLARHAQVVAAARSGGRSIAELRRLVYGDLNPELASAADASIRAHLVYMRETGETVPPIEDAASGCHGPVEA